MRDFSKVSPSLWKSRKFKSMKGDDDAKMVYLYLLSCPHGNSSGCFDLHPMYACADLEWDNIRYQEAIETLLKADLIMFDGAENTILIVKWHEFNEASNPKHAIGILTQLEQASSSRLKSIAFHAFLQCFRVKSFDKDSSLRKAIEVFLIDYPEGIRTETKTKTETKTEIETRLDLDKTETREKPRGVLRTVAAEGRNGLAPNPKSQSPPRSPLLETPLMKGTS